MANQTMTISANGSPCTLRTTNIAKITCYTSAGLTASTIDVTVNTITSSIAFSYSSNDMPIITDVYAKNQAAGSPHMRTASPVQKTDLIVEGRNLCAAGKSYTRDSYVCYLDFLGKKNAEIYTLPVYACTETQIICILGGGNVSDYNLRLYRKNFGSAKVDNSSVNTAFSYQFDLLSISPVIGGMAGGTELTITGTNLALQFN